MSNAVEDFLNALKRTINGDPYPASGSRRYAPVSYRVVSLRDPLQDVLLSGKYRVESRIGKGAMACVYKAIQEPIDRVVALKILSKEFSMVPVNVKRFQLEAKTLSSLKHRNILSIHDLGCTDDGQPYLVMEFLDGITLEKLIAKRGPVPMARAVPIFCQICEGMSYAHKQGLIHRDLKPGNVMLVTEEDGTELVKLLDFGIVKNNRESQKISQKLTQKGEIWGSPVYMSPEQCMGLALDGRSDLYSLGLLMYESLLGTPAFKGGEAIGTIISRQLSEMPASFKEMAPTLRIPERLEQIVFKTLQKKSVERYSSMDELKTELEAFGRQLGIKQRSSLEMKADSSRSISESKMPENASLKDTDAAPQTEIKARPRSKPGSGKSESQAHAETARPSMQPLSNRGPSIGQLKILIGASAAFLVLVLVIIGVGVAGFLKQLQSAVDEAPNMLIRATEKRPERSSSHDPLLKTGAEKSTSTASSKATQTTSNHSQPKKKLDQSTQNSNIKKTAEESATFREASNNKALSADKDTPISEPHADERVKKAAAAAPVHQGTQNKATALVHQKTQNTAPIVRGSSKRLPGKTKSGPSNNATEPDDQLLERIHLRKHHYDSTQQWLEIQQKEQSE